VLEGVRLLQIVWAFHIRRQRQQSRVVGIHLPQAEEDGPQQSVVLQVGEKCRFSNRVKKAAVFACPDQPIMKFLISGSGMRFYACSNVNNGVLKKLVALMVDKGLSGKSIENYLQVPKMVVASVVDDEGNQVYPRKWNHEFMDVPLVEKSKQNTPSFSSEIMAHSRNGRSRRNVCCSFFAVRLALG
jgi:hypothetical protein